MSYEYKDLIKTYTEYIMDDYEVVDYIEDGKELNHVYAQAAKADEYEAKVKAFDAIDEIYADRTTTRIAKYFRAVEVINKFYDGKEDK